MRPPRHPGRPFRRKEKEITLEHKDIVLPEVDLSDDEADPEWKGEDFDPVPTPQGTYRWIRPPDIHKNYWEAVQEGWERTAREFEEDPSSFYRSWHYLNGHPVYWNFKRHDDGRPPNHVSRLEEGYGFGSSGIDVHVALVDETGHVNDDDSLNTETEIWLETGKWNLFPESDGHSEHWHDTELDTGGPTYEEAVIKLALAVWKRYGNDRRIADDPEALRYPEDTDSPEPV